MALFSAEIVEITELRVDTAVETDIVAAGDAIAETTATASATTAISESTTDDLVAFLRLMGVAPSVLENHLPAKLLKL